MIEHPDVDYDLVRELKATVSDRVRAERQAAKADGQPLDAADERMLARTLIDQEVQEAAAGTLTTAAPLDADAEEALAEAVFNELYALGRIQPLIDDPNISAVQINGCDEVHIKLANGDMVEGPPVADSDDELVRMITRAAQELGHTGQRFDKGGAWQMSLGLPGGARLHAVRAVSARPYVTIRQHDLRIHSLEHLVELEVIDEQLQKFLAAAVAAKANIIVAGGQDAGKTTFLRCLCNAIPTPKRMLITVEDPPELHLNEFPEHHMNLRQLFPQPANTEGRGAVTAAELTQATLRMDPDRVVVGEILRGEIVSMLLAMSQGTNGSMSTMHGGSVAQVVDRASVYAEFAEHDISEESIKRLFGHAVDLIIHLGLDGQTRRVTAISDIDWDRDSGKVAVSRLWRSGPDNRAAAHLPPRSELQDRLRAVGYGPQDYPRQWVTKR